MKRMTTLNVIGDEWQEDEVLALFAKCGPENKPRWWAEAVTIDCLLYRKFPEDDWFYHKGMPAQNSADLQGATCRGSGEKDGYINDDLEDKDGFYTDGMPEWRVDVEACVKYIVPQLVADGWNISMYASDDGIVTRVEDDTHLITNGDFCQAIVEACLTWIDDKPFHVPTIDEVTNANA